MRAAGKLPPPLVAALSALALVALGGIGFSVYAHGRYRHAVSTTDRIARELIALNGAHVALTPANAARATANREALAAQLAAFQSELRRGAASQPEASPFATSQDLFFDVVSMIERLREAASAAGVRLADDDRENFGFDDLIRRGTAPIGPEGDAVYRDRLAIEYLVRALLAAQPQALLAVQRETATATAGTPSRTTGDGGLGDAFEVDPSMTAAVPGAIATQGIRLIFTGRTASLRQFLAQLAAFERPLVVRSVEVRPAVERAPARGGASTSGPGSSGTPRNGSNPFDSLFGFGGQQSGGAAGTAAEEAPVPLVADNLSRFTVTVEAFRLVSEPAAAGEAEGEAQP